MFIYGLQDPITYELHYVGATKNIEKRFDGHIKESKERFGWFNYKKSNWIFNLLEKGMCPEIFIIEEVDKNWQEKEKFWIAYFRYIGSNLFNLTDGGEGGDTVSNNPRKEIFLKSSADKRRGRKRGTWEEQLGVERAAKIKLQMSLRQRGKPSGMLGKKHTEETKNKMKRSSRKGISNIEFFGEEKAREIKNHKSAAQKGRVISEEHRKKIVKTATGKKRIYREDGSFFLGRIPK